jgi:hypothetical protein
MNSKHASRRNSKAISAARPSRLFPVVRGKHLALVLVGVVLGLGCASLGPVSKAHAGEWVQRSCSYGVDFIEPEGWEGVEQNGFKNPLQGRPFDSCLDFPYGGGLQAIAAGAYGDQPGAGEVWRYQAPHDSTLAGGILTATLSAPNGDAVIAASAKNGLVILANCEKQANCPLPGGWAPITAVGGTELYEKASCSTNGTAFCPSEQSLAASVTITSAQIVLATNAAPGATGFSGTLLNETVSGTGTLSFTATDPGPGVYQVKVLIDGHQVWAATPSLNEGKCVAQGTYEEARAFNHEQPCPTSTPVSAEIDTTILADGSHHLAVEVEDAAGNITAVHSSTLTTANHPVTPIVLPPNRGTPNGTPASDHALLTTRADQPRTFTRTLAHSAVTLSGDLTNATGTPITGAQIQLSERVVGSTAPASHLLSTTTGPSGAWTLQVPKGPSRLLLIAYYSHLLDSTPTATLDFHERVRGVLSMRAPRRVRLGQAVNFSGQLLGGYVPSGGESVQMEIFYGRRWRTIDVLPTTNQGRWTYKYVFILGAGTSYRFRAITVSNGGYPFLPAYSKPVRVTIQR